MNISERLNIIIKEKGISIRALEQKIGCSNGVLSRCISKNTDISSQWVSKIIETYTDIDSRWLLTGEGEMIKADSQTESLSTDNAKQTDTRPRIPFDAAAGSLSHPVGSVTMRDCEQMPVIPNLPRYDFTIFARGDSMLPQYFSGDELACLYVKDSSFIQWGRAHVLDTAQGIVIKRIFDNGDSILCKSNNPQYHDFSIPKTEIYRIAIVVGFVRIE